MPTRVAFVLDSFSTAAAGTEKQFLALVSALDRTRFEPHVFLLRGADRLSAVLPDTPVKILDIQSILSPFAVSAAWRFSRSLRERSFAMAHLYFNDSSVLLPWLLRLAGIRVIVSRRDLGIWYTPWILRALRIQRHAVDAVVANSGAVRDRVCEAERFARKRVSVIYNGLSTPSRALSKAEARARLELPESARVLVVVANVKPLKRVGDVIAALPEIARAHPEVVLLAVGADYPGWSSSSHVAELSREAANLGVSSHVRFVGAQADAWPFMVAADVCLLCSETEGLSNAVIEYMLAGRPVVATRVGGNPELLSDSECGFLVPVGRPDRIAAAVLAYLADEKLAAAHGEAARRSATLRFGVSAMVAAHQELYARVA